MNIAARSKKDTSKTSIGTGLPAKRMKSVDHWPEWQKTVAPNVGHFADGPMFGASRHIRLPAGNDPETGKRPRRKAGALGVGQSPYALNPARKSSREDTRMRVERISILPVR